MPGARDRFYVDTSVFGGVFDREFEEASQAFFDEARAGRFAVVVSALVASEVADAPEPVAALFQEILELAESTPVSSDALTLRDAYVGHGVVAAKWGTDALHVALATVAGCTAVVSWNFKHIVHLDKARGYNGVNLLLGHGSIRVCAPWEVLSYEEDI